MTDITNIVCSAKEVVLQVYVFVVRGISFQFNFLSVTEAKVKMNRVYKIVFIVYFNLTPTIIQICYLKKSVLHNR